MGGSILAGPRVGLRLLTLDDLDAFHAIWGDEQVIFWGASADRGASRARLVDFVERSVDGVDPSGWFAIVRRADLAVVGDVVLEPASWDPEVVEIGWHVARAHQRQGYASEAATLLVDHAFACGLDHVAAKILPTNLASRKVAQRLGLDRVGRIEHAGQQHDLWELCRPSQAELPGR